MTEIKKTTLTRPDPAGTKSVARVFALLEYVAESPSGATFTQISKDLAMPKSSLHSLLVIATDVGWIYKSEESGRFHIGLRAWQVGQSFAAFDSLAQVALPFMTAVRDEVQETVQLAVLAGIDNIYVAKVEAEHELRLVSTVGSRLPAYATGIGKALLASLDAAELRRRMKGVELGRFTPQTIRTMAALEAAVAEIRLKGYAEDDGEYTPGIHCVAVPVHGGAGEIVAAISCSASTARLAAAPTLRKAILESLQSQAALLSRQLAAAKY